MNHQIAALLDIIALLDEALETLVTMRSTASGTEAVIIAGAEGKIEEAIAEVNQIDRRQWIDWPASEETWPSQDSGCDDMGFGT